MPKVLIVDDQAAVRTALETLFELGGLTPIAVSSAEEALEQIATEDIGAVVQDMNFTEEQTSGADGMRLFRAIRELDPDMPVVLITSWTSLETAVALLKEGASDYVAKPWDQDKLLRTVENLVDLRRLKHDNIRLLARERRARSKLAGRHDLRGLIYTSPQMHEAVHLAIAVAPSDASILITGPNGAGKEKIAEIIVANSRRRDRPFIKVNVGALPDSLFEAELFGAEAGAFTGAAKTRIGRFEAAEGGTLFLDELGTLPLASQAKLLRVLQTGEFERLGSSHTRKADVRVVSATNVDLARAIAAGTFREDLYFRLNTIEVFVPPLADRPDDILPLAHHFLALAAPARSFGESALSALGDHDWPGNVRELQNRVQRAVLTAAAESITAADLGLGDSPRAPGARRAGAPVAAAAIAPAPPAPAGAPMDDADAMAERGAIREALIRAGGVVARAAADLGLSRQALYRRMDRLDVVLERRLR
ncbi:MAG TPA: sigma-54 dependent transcriptional regulator [Polyangia bacterium]|nr:sigma-54 dependent transcriptional regulator [Polyangia bacterium]